MHTYICIDLYTNIYTFTYKMAEQSSSRRAPSILHTHTHAYICTHNCTQLHANSNSTQPDKLYIRTYIHIANGWMQQRSIPHSHKPYTQTFTHTADRRKEGCSNLPLPNFKSSECIATHQQILINHIGKLRARVGTRAQ